MAAKKKVSRKRRSTKEDAVSPEQVQQVLTGISSEPSSSSEIVEKTGLAIDVVRLALQDLVSSKQVTKEGQKRWTRYRLASGQSPALPARVSSDPSRTKLESKKSPRTEVRVRAPKRDETDLSTQAPETARAAVLAWLGSPESSFWENAQDVSKSLSLGSGIPRMEIQAEIRELIKQNRIQREFCKGPEGQYRKIKRA